MVNLISEEAAGIHDGTKIADIVTKEEVQRRTQLLMKNVMKKPLDKEDALPGDNTNKYALRYRPPLGENWIQIITTSIRFTHKFPKKNII